MTEAAERPSELYSMAADPDVPGGRCLTLSFHEGQTEAWESGARFVVVLAGTQSGKTSWAPFWLHREIYGGAYYGEPDRHGRGPGDYLAVTATYDLFKLKLLPAMREVFENLFGVGRYWSGDRIFELKDPLTDRFWARRADDPMWGRVILRSAEAGSGLESSTAKAAILDEAGQDSFTDETWRAVLSRLSLNMGRCLLPTTLYNFGWLKRECYDRWRAGDPDFHVVHFDSVVNPLFSRKEWDRARRSMADWKFDLRYRGRYSRPAGLIYDSYHDEQAPAGQLIKRFAISPTWPRYLGLDFGGVHTAGVFVAERPSDGRLFIYREYLEGDRTAADHTAGLLHLEPPIALAAGGSASEGQWRKEFERAGLEVKAPDVDSVDVGIDRVYGGFKTRQVYVFDDLAGLRTELTSYSRKLDKKSGEPTAVIEDKSKYHRLDALRYIMTWLMGPGPGEGAVTASANPLAGYRGTARSFKAANAQRGQEF